MGDKGHAAKPDKKHGKSLKEKRSSKAAKRTDRSARRASW
jgi:hypothetical protein